MRQLFQESRAQIDAFYYYPHHLRTGHGSYTSACNYRKQNPGLLLQPAREFYIELSKSHLIGDHRQDIEMTRPAAYRPMFVKTGHELAKLEYSTPEKEKEPGAHFPDLFAKNALEMVNWILKEQIVPLRGPRQG